jgi:hypothetical protein
LNHDNLTRALLKAQPKAFLDALLAGEQKAVTEGIHFINQLARLRRNPLDEVSEGTVFEWCAEDPASRFPVAAALVSVFALEDDQNPAAWTPIASRLVWRFIHVEG